MSSSRIASRYAKPILELAEGKNILDEVKNDMEAFTRIYKSNRDFVLMLKSPIIPHLKKAVILKELFKGKINDLTHQAFQLIARKNREHILNDIAEEFLHVYDMKKGRVKISIKTKQRLDGSQRGVLEKLAKKITGKNPILEQDIDPLMIGGFVMNLGDKRIDQSVSSQLKKIKLKLQTKK